MIDTNEETDKEMTMDPTADMELLPPTPSAEDRRLEDLAAALTDARQRLARIERVLGRNLEGNVLDLELPTKKWVDDSIARIANRLRANIAAIDKKVHANRPLFARLRDAARAVRRSFSSPPKMDDAALAMHEKIAKVVDGAGN